MARDAAFITRTVPAVLRCIDADNAVAMARACEEMPVEATVRVQVSASRLPLHFMRIPLNMWLAPPRMVW